MRSTKNNFIPPPVIGQPILKVVGVGGAGNNAINRMIQENVQGVEFISLNTDAQALDNNLSAKKLQLGSLVTRGLGAGGDPKIGEAAARESEKSIQEFLNGADMVFITAGMGGGTGTGAAAVVAEIAKRMGILTVAVVTKPFEFEGARRKRIGDEGIVRLKENIDTLIVVPNQRLLSVVKGDATLGEAFAAADDVLRHGVQGISDIILMPGNINVDFADVKSVMQNAGVALMGLGQGVGLGRAKPAAEAAVNSPLLETSMQGAKKLLVNITAASDFSLVEAHEVMEYILQFADDKDTEVFMGHVPDPTLDGGVFVCLLATGMENPPSQIASKGIKKEISSGDKSIPDFSPESALAEKSFNIPDYLKNVRDDYNIK